MKIERNPSEPRLILTVWGRGYKLAEEPAAC
jgi:DNA-binding response OmpR family regulator